MVLGTSSHWSFTPIFVFDLLSMNSCLCSLGLGVPLFIELEAKMSLRSVSD